MKINDLIIKSKKIIDNNKLDSSVSIYLLEYVLKVDSKYIYSNLGKNISFFKKMKYFYYINKYINNFPYQYIIKKSNFYMLDLYINKNVLIPRYDTEKMVEDTINIINSNKNKQYKILDLCTGSGAIAIAISKNCKNASVYASDISKKALKIAKYNACYNNCNIKFIKSNIFKNIFDKFDIIISNPPYLNKRSYIEKSVKKEPKIALYSKDLGFYIINNILNNYNNYLKENGFLIFEHDPSQVTKIKNIKKDAITYKAYNKLDRYTIVR